MNMQRIEIMGPEYVLMLGVWWGAAVLLTVIFLAAKRVWVRHGEQRQAGRAPMPAPGNRSDL